MLTKFKRLFSGIAVIKRLFATNRDLVKNTQLKPTDANTIKFIYIIIIAFFITFAYVFINTHIALDEQVTRTDATLGTLNGWQSGSDVVTVLSSPNFHTGDKNFSVFPDPLKEIGENTEPTPELANSNWAAVGEQTYGILDSWWKLFTNFNNKFQPSIVEPPIDSRQKEEFISRVPPDHYQEYQEYIEEPASPIRQNLTWHELTTELVALENKLAATMSKISPQGELPELYPEPESKPVPEPIAEIPPIAASWQTSAQKLWLVEQELANIMQKLVLDGTIK